MGEAIPIQPVHAAGELEEDAGVEVQYTEEKCYQGSWVNNMREGYGIQTDIEEEVCV